MRRVSTMWIGSKKQRSVSDRGIGRQKEKEPYYSEDESGEYGQPDEIDDIRRPSGLGRAVSIESGDINQTEASPVETNGSHFSAPPSSFYMLSKSRSTPSLVRNLSRKFSKSGKDKPVPPLPPSSSSRSLLLVPQFPSPPTHYPPSPISARFSISTTPGPDPAQLLKPFPPLPVEVLAGILSFLPRLKIYELSALSHSFHTAANSILYTSLSQPRHSLIRLLASRADIAELVRTFILRLWPSSFPCEDDGMLILGKETATFTIALQNMSSLRRLVLPKFDLALLRHHTAFGLSSVEFLQDQFDDEDAQREVFGWLDGQINITDLAFTNLLEPEVQKGEQPASDFLARRPTLTSPPQSISTLLCSPTLLPNLRRIHITPTLLAHLAPTRSSLSDVSININSTLYTGLRPASLISSLRGKTVRRLRFWFFEEVDRRTQDKVLSSASSLDGIVELGVGVKEGEGRENVRFSYCLIVSRKS